MRVWSIGVPRNRSPSCADRHGTHEVPEIEVAWAASLDRGAGNWESLLDSVSTLYVHGINLDWTGLHAMRRPKRVILPTYPFQRSREHSWRRKAGGADCRGTGRRRQ